MRTLLLILIFIAAPALAAENTDTIAGACAASTNLGGPVCECCERKANEGLSEGGRKLLLAMLQKNQAEVDALKAKLPFPDIMAASMFMVSTPGECAGEQPAQ